MFYEVTYSASFTTRIKVEKGGSLSDALCGITVPEDKDSCYVSESFEVKEILDEYDNKVPESEIYKN